MLLNSIKLIEFLPDIINSIVLLSIIFFFYIEYKIKKFYVYILIISLLFPFVFYFFMDWSVLPDQSKYSSQVYKFRNLSFEGNFSDLFSKITFSSLLLSFFPIPFVTTVVSISLINKGILILTTIYFIKKKYYYVVSLLLFLPSMIVISSVALRDMLVIANGILFVYFFIDKKNFLISLVFASVLLIIKTHLSIFIIATCFVYFLIFEKLKIKKINKESLIFLFIIMLILFILSYFANNQLIHYKKGFYIEQFGYSPYISGENFSLNFHSVILSYFNFTFSPLSTEEINLKNIIIFIESMFVIFLIIVLIRKIYIENKLKALFWLITFFTISGIHGFILTNAGTIWRYKLIIHIIFLCAAYFSVKKTIK